VFGPQFLPSTLDSIMSNVANRDPPPSRIWGDLHLLEGIEVSVSLFSLSFHLPRSVSSLLSAVLVILPLQLQSPLRLLCPLLDELLQAILIPNMFFSGKKTLAPKKAASAAIGT